MAGIRDNPTPSESSLGFNTAAQSLFGIIDAFTTVASGGQDFWINAYQTGSGHIEGTSQKVGHWPSAWQYWEVTTLAHSQKIDPCPPFQGVVSCIPVFGWGTPTTISCTSLTPNCDHWINKDGPDDPVGTNAGTYYVQCPGVEDCGDRWVPSVADKETYTQLPRACPAVSPTLHDCSLTTNIISGTVIDKFWEEGEPNSADERCMEVYAGDTGSARAVLRAGLRADLLNDENCADELPFLCQKPQPCMTGWRHGDRSSPPLATEVVGERLTAYEFYCPTWAGWAILKNHECIDCRDYPLHPEPPFHVGVICTSNVVGADNPLLNPWHDRSRGGELECVCACSAGQGSNAETGKCFTCSKGHYGDGQICIPCPRGTIPNDYKVSNGDPECAECGAGKIANDDQSMCVDCPVGKYSATAGQSACENCAAGKYGRRIGYSMNCVSCAAGKYSDALGAADEGMCTD